MQASREFARYVRENGVNSGSEVCGIYRLVRLVDGRRMVATFIDPYNQGNHPMAELRVFVQNGLDAEENGIGNPTSLSVFEQGQWIRIERTERTMQEYQGLLGRYLKGLYDASGACRVRSKRHESGIGMAA